MLCEVMLKSATANSASSGSVFDSEFHAAGMIPTVASSGDLLMGSAAGIRLLA